MCHIRFSCISPDYIRGYTSNMAAVTSGQRSSGNMYYVYAQYFWRYTLTLVSMTGSGKYTVFSNNYQVFGLV